MTFIDGAVIKPLPEFVTLSSQWRSRVTSCGCSTELHSSPTLHNLLNGIPTTQSTGFKSRLFGGHMPSSTNVAFSCRGNARVFVWRRAVLPRGSRV